MQLVHAFSEQPGKFHGPRQDMVDTAFQQFREKFGRDIVTAQIKSLRRKRQIGRSILGFKRFENAIHHIVHLDQRTNIKQDQLVDQINERHQERIVFHISGNDKQGYRNKRQCGNCN